MLAVALIILYLDFWLLTTGFLIAHFRDSFPDLDSPSNRRDDRITGYLVGAAGPIGFFSFMIYLLCHYGENPRMRLQLW